MSACQQTLRGSGLDLRELPSPDSPPCSDIFSFNRKISFLKSAMMLVYWAMWYDTLNWLGLVCKHKSKIIQISQSNEIVFLAFDQMVSKQGRRDVMENVRFDCNQR